MYGFYSFLSAAFPVPFLQFSCRLYLISIPIYFIHCPRFTFLKLSSSLVMPNHLKQPCLQTCLTFQNLLPLPSTLFLPICICILFVSGQLDSVSCSSCTFLSLLSSSYIISKLSNLNLFKNLNLSKISKLKFI